MTRLRLKVAVIGDAGVGKTSLIKRYIGHPFSEIYVRTLGVDFFSKAEVFKANGTLVKVLLDIHDFGGQEGFIYMRRLAYFGTHVGIVVFDVSNRVSLRNTARWIKEFLMYAGRKPIVLVGNKVDLRGSEDCVAPEEGEAMAEFLSERFGIQTSYVESSVKLGINISAPFKLAIYHAFRSPELREYIAMAIKA